jgi:hypothetical protein
MMLTALTAAVAEHALANPSPNWTSHIGLLGKRFHVDRLRKALDDPGLWDRHTLRTASYGTPHSHISDIWVRYNDWANYTGDYAAFNGPHESVWYPVANEIPVRSLAMEMMHFVGGTKLGGILITKIPAGQRVEPHVDNGWHAQHYEKFAISIAANEQQAFCFEGERLVTRTGDSFHFDNSALHWVDNDSDEDRITMICCIRRT